MSKKIYDAFRINCSIQELHDLLSEFQELVNEAAVEIAHERYSDLLASHEYSSIANQLGIEQQSPLKNFMKDGFSLLSGLYFKVWDAEQKIKKTGMSMPQFDFSCEVVVYPYQNQFLLKFFSSQKRYLDILRTNSKFREYEYWNNTDKPLHVSQEEWDQRAAVWDEVTQDMTYAQSGYTRQIYTGLQPLMPNKLIEIANKRYSKSQRLHMFAKNILEYRLSEDPNWKNSKPHEIIQYVNSQEAEVVLIQIESEIKDCILEEYTAEMLSETQKE